LLAENGQKLFKGLVLYQIDSAKDFRIMSSSQHFSSHKHSYLLLRNDIIIQFNSPKWASQVRSMILGQVSWLDCFVFLVFLAPQLIIHVGFFPTLFCGLKALPFLGMLDTLFI
jgi:hypothetical protein